MKVMKVFKAIFIVACLGLGFLIGAGVVRYLQSLPSTRVDRVEKNLTGYKLIGGPDIFEGSCQGETESDVYVAVLDNATVTVSSSGNSLTKVYDDGTQSVTAEFYPNEGIALRMKSDTDPVLYGIPLTPCGEKVRSP